MDPEDRIITIECSKCGKVLYKGSEKDAKGLIVYCADC
jgi:phage FluMu protein Com